MLDSFITDVILNSFGTASIVVCRVSIKDATKCIQCMECMTVCERCHIKITDSSINLNSAVVGKLLSQASGRMQVEEHLKVVENNFILPRGRVSLRTFKKLFLSVVMVVSNLKV